MPPSLNSLHPFGPFPLLTPPPDMRHHLEYKQNMDMRHRMGQENARDQRMQDEWVRMSDQESVADDEDDDDEDGIVVDEEDISTDKYRSDNEDTFENGTRHDDYKLKAFMAYEEKHAIVSSDAEDMSSNDDTQSLNESQRIQSGDMGVNLSNNKRKRKSQNPTRCATISGAVGQDEDSNEVVSYADAKSSVKKRRSISEDRTEDSKESEMKTPPQFKASPKILPSPPPTPASDNKLRVKQEPEEDQSSKEEDEPENLTLDLSKKRVEQSSVENENKQSLKSDINANEVKQEARERHSAGLLEGENRHDEIEKSNAQINALLRLENLSQNHLNELLAQRQNLLAAATSPQIPDMRLMMENSPLSPARSQASSLEENEVENYQDGDEDLPVYDPYENNENGMATSADRDQLIKCGACRKVFQNHFGVKHHYENAHLKLLHKCNIDGCNAGFSSKRSRDRHSSNLNLHRKLLSTSSDHGDEDKSKQDVPLMSAASLQSELLARLYSESQLPLNLEALKHLPAPFAEHLLNAAAAMHRSKLSAGDQPGRPNHELPLRYNSNPLLFPGLSPFATHLLPHHPFNGFVSNSSGSNRHRPPSNDSNPPVSASSPPTLLSMGSPVSNNNQRFKMTSASNDEEMRRPSSEGALDLHQQPPHNLQFQRRTPPENMS